MSPRRIFLLFVSTSGLILALPVISRSQAAWVPAQGEGSVTFSYQNLDARDHLNFNGTRSSALGAVHAHTAVIDFEYGITDRLALNVDLAFVASRYKGQIPESPFDNGFYHPTFQDFHFHVRYKLIKSPVVFTPFIGITVPTHDYQVAGHSAVGRGFHELLIGAAVGRQLGPFWPDLYVHASYGQSILKRFQGLNVNRGNAEWEVGWAPTERLTLRFLGFAQKSFGGFNLPIDLHSEEDHEIHDRVARANFARLGGGGTYSMNRSFEINLNYAKTVWGRNIHAVGGVVLGVTWRFSRGFDIREFPVRDDQKDFYHPAHQ